MSAIVEFTFLFSMHAVRGGRLMVFFLMVQEHRGLTATKRAIQTVLVHDSHGNSGERMKQPRCWMSDLGPSKSNFGFGHWVNWGQVPVTRSLNCACGLHFSWREEVWVGWAWSRLPTRASCVDATRSKDGQDNQAQWKNFAGALPWIRFTLNWSFVD